jgi:hypothetical protein
MAVSDHHKTQPRDSKGRWTIMVCVNAHDRCMQSDTGPCPYCEPRQEPRKITGFFATLTPEQQAAALAYTGPDGPIGKL